MVRGGYIVVPDLCLYAYRDELASCQLCLTRFLRTPTPLRGLMPPPQICGLRVSSATVSTVSALLTAFSNSADTTRSSLRNILKGNHLICY